MQEIKDACDTLGALANRLHSLNRHAPNRETRAAAEECHVLAERLRKLLDKDTP